MFKKIKFNAFGINVAYRRFLGLAYIKNNCFIKNPCMIQHFKSNTKISLESIYHNLLSQQTL
ncbi:DUF261 family protein [Borreliella garinii]|uniref:DUF261 family protein n=1 Tax=Borreliella garinii TaxID=29519 RepID=UPI00399CF4A4